MNKFILSETFLIKGQIPLEVSSIDTEYLKKFILEHDLEFCVASKDTFHYDRDYYNLNFNRNIQWVYEYIRDHYRTKYHRTLINLDENYKAQIINKNKSIDLHDHIDWYRLDYSPDISGIYVVSNKKPYNEIVFEFTDHRHLMKMYKIPLEPNTFILWNSSIKHRITENTNDEPTVNLSFKWQSK